MESEKVKEIKKALEQNIKSGLGYEDNNKFCNIMFTDILILINELESENERLKTSEFESCMELGNCSYQIHNLEERIAELEKENATLVSNNADGGASCHLCMSYHKKNALKQFAERLKEKDLSVPLHKDFIIIDNKAIDETLKEFINERD